MTARHSATIRTLSIAAWTSSLLLSASATAIAANLDVSGTPGQTYTVSGDETYDRVNAGNAAGETGTINVNAGNTLTTGSTGAVGTSLGNAPTTTGTINVTGTGATYTDNGYTYVGDTGAGAINVTSGGTLQTTNLYMNAQSSSLTVTGPGSSWTNTAGVNIGNDNTATDKLTISDGAIANLLNIGLYMSGGSDVTITGTDTEVTLSNPGDPENGAWISAGGGTLLLSDGATLNTDGAYLGNDPADQVDMTVTGQGTVWNSIVRVYIGGGSGTGGTGELTVSDGAVINTATGITGLDTGSTGTMTLTGAGTLFHAVATPSVGALGNFYVSYAGDSNVLVTDGAELKVDNELRIATWAGSTGTLSIGAKKGNAAAKAGIITAPAIVFGDGTGTVVFNHTSDDLSFSSVFTGTGSIDQVAGTTILTGASTGFTGTTDVEGGTLIVNGTLGDGTSTLNLLSGATLAGTGTIGGNVVDSGILSPGQSVGTLNVGGNFTFNGGSTFNIEAASDGATTDTLAAAGNVVINGGDVVLTNGYFLPTKTYTIITSGGTVSGTFDTASYDYYAFVTPELTYNPANVQLTLTRNATAFSALATTPNAQAAANGLDSLGSGSPIHDAILGLTPENAGAAFNYLSGEINASVISGLLGGSHFVSDNVLSHIRKVFGWQGAGPTPKVVADAGDGSSAFPFSGQTTAVWAQTFGAWGHTNGDGNASKLKSRRGGFVAGADKQLSDNLRIGVFAGYQRSKFDENAIASSADVDSYELGVYSGTELSGLGLRGGASFTWHNIDTSRSVVAGLFSNHLTGSTDARTAQLFGEASYPLSAGAVTYEPFLDAAIMSISTDGYTETGGAGALTVNSDTTTMGSTTLGGRLSTGFALADMPVRLTGTAGWRHGFGKLTPDTTASFSGGTPFTVSGTPIARDAAVLGADLGVALSASTSLGLSYDGQFSDNANDNTVKARLVMAF
ncbi:autotransporter outer membrane beta-barrel domain-containing protein [Parvibaculum sp. MBR-TMA-1.3b-4.2]